eukprot:GEMP01070942.1.p1 GENE.GEMP01070942.1~~GEMP01070942.1.p1  ORF type:complete len:320 (+),score=73.35 GEMP01070942.1:121-1080(+)
MSVLWLLLTTISCSNELGALLASSKFPKALASLQEMHAKEPMSDAVKADVTAFAAQLRAQCDKLMAFTTETYRNFATDGPSVAAATQWAQNRTHVFGQIKFAHRWTSPGALEVVNPVVEVRDGNFHFEAIGQHSGLKKRYAFTAPLHASVEPPPLSSWSLASVGRLTFTLQKVEEKKWPRLTKEKKTTHQITLWVHMQEMIDASELEKKERAKAAEDAASKAKETKREVERQLKTAARDEKRQKHPYSWYFTLAKWVLGILGGIYFIGQLVNHFYKPPTGEAERLHGSSKSRLLDKEKEAAAQANMSDVAPPPYHNGTD